MQPTKLCLKCNITKPTSAFHKRSKKGRQPYCKLCRKQIDADYWKANKSRLHPRKLERKREIHEWVVKLKAQPCSDCGVQYPHYVMHFDHIDPTSKTANICDAVRNGWSKNRILVELETCELVCGNCHAERTYQRR